jgi:hypothetical protein
MDSKPKYIIFKDSNEELGDALFKYFASSLFCIKYNYEYILEEDIQSKIDDYIFYQGLDHINDDIERIETNTDNLKNICKKNENALCFNTFGYIKHNFEIDKLSSNQYINSGSHGLYVKNIINIYPDNFFKHYENCKINNLMINGKFYFGNIFFENKSLILDFIEKNKNIHKIKIQRIPVELVTDTEKSEYEACEKLNKNNVFLLKDLIDDIELGNKKYDLVIHINFKDLYNFIEYKSIISFIKNIDLKNKKFAIVLQKCDYDISNYLDNITSWFKQNNIEINIELNDLITNFNIMKQCKILVCSNDSLSWSACYLSNYLQVCYIPINKTNPNRSLSRFIKPIENTIFYNSSKIINCYICGTVLNCEKYLNSVCSNILNYGLLSSIFAKVSSSFGKRF